MRVEKGKMERRYIAIVVFPLEEGPLRPRIRGSEGFGAGAEAEGKGGFIEVAISVAEGDGVVNKYYGRRCINSTYF